LKTSVHEPQLILREDGVAALSDVGEEIGRGRGRQQAVLEIFVLDS